jgi:hypothetical protein
MLGMHVDSIIIMACAAVHCTTSHWANQCSVGPKYYCLHTASPVLSCCKWMPGLLL